jgi:5-methylcytosine-specific restriction endonuclease McrA
MNTVGVFLTMTRVLLLNADYEPINICTINRAMKLILKGKAEPLHIAEGKFIYSAGGFSHQIPSVIRLNLQVKKRYNKEFKVSRLGVYARDNFTCQYCSSKDSELTLDHIYPRHLGGTHTWDNLVACCKKCNNTKAWKTLDQAGMKLLSKPKCPKYSFHTIIKNYIGSDYEEWNYYLV